MHPVAALQSLLWRAGMVATQMTAEMKGSDERKIQPSDIAEAAMLAVRTSNSACPQVNPASDNSLGRQRSCSTTKSIFLPPKVASPM